jgi:hypothetical protein
MRASSDCATILVSDPNGTVINLASDSTQTSNGEHSSQKWITTITVSRTSCRP